MKKIGLVLIIALLTLSAAGCTLPSGTDGKASPTPTPYPTDITPGVITTQQPPVTATPVSSDWLSGYQETTLERSQSLPNGVKVTYSKYYKTDDWMMPFPLGGPRVNQANHGAVMLVKFYNPTSSTQSIVLDSDVKAAFSYLDANGVRRGLVTADVFYDKDTGKQFTEISIAPNETRTLYILAYVSSDADYEKTAGRLDWPTLDANPGYVQG
ncbi:hypothetical protein [Methanocella arvoryzae]|uniref:hypothetical protein n=1 Tax=Methanocella arvoryzae TaxID=1175445 RepID=UPI00064EF06F|nr:hypothetical protein [Methanocella arvoryzae]